MELLIKKFLPEYFQDDKYNLLNFHKVFSLFMSGQYACAVTVNSKFRRNPFARKRSIHEGVTMEELFVYGAKELTIDTFGFPKVLTGIRPFERVEFNDLFYMKVKYQNISKREIRSIENEVSFLFSRI